MIGRGSMISHPYSAWTRRYAGFWLPRSIFTRMVVTTTQIIIVLLVVTVYQTRFSVGSLNIPDNDAAPHTRHTTVLRVYPG